LSRADVLAELIRDVNSSLDPERVADALVDHVADWLPMSSWLVLVIDDVGHVRSLGARSLTPLIEPGATAVGQWVLRTEDLCCVSDLSEDKRFGAAVSAAALGFPLQLDRKVPRGHLEHEVLKGHLEQEILDERLLGRRRTIGALVGVDRNASSKEPRFAPATLAALRLALEPGAIALDNALRLQRAEALSVTDDLTQLYNRRYLLQVLGRETKRASRSNRPLSLLFVDLDGFKSINDTVGLGHQFGSRALVEAGAVIRSSARETDIVARFGGDEFTLILPDTGSDGAAAVGERIRERIAEHSFLKGDGLDVHLTVSVGVATLPDTASTADGLMQAADEAMYFVKNHGKNGIHIAGA
jgi:diguanylate cyclase (GGDEF)-like protein